MRRISREYYFCFCFVFFGFVCFTKGSENKSKNK